MSSSATRKPPAGCYFDEAAAQRAVQFFEVFLHHGKGEWYGHPFELQPWERQIIRDLFGWKRPDGSRLYRVAYIEVPRKNGKTSLGAGIGLYLTLGDNEPGAEVYCAASDREQARICFEIASGMVGSSPELRRRAKVYRNAIVAPRLLSSYKVLSSDAHTKHGFNVHGAIIDELHAHPSRDLYDVLKTGTAARRQPLVVVLTTAGFDRNSVCWELHEQAERVLSGKVKDPSFYACIYGAKTDEDWTSPKVWAKANPNYQVTIKREYFEQECRQAQITPTYENTFRRLHLNQWTQQATRWMPMQFWDLGKTAIDAERLKGRPCYAGLDLATSIDLAALVLVFPPVDGEKTYQVVPHFWIPAENLEDRARRDKVPYRVWAKQGFIQPTEGNVIDYAAILERIDRTAKTYQLVELAKDPWGSVQLGQQLQDLGMNVIDFPQGFKSMSPASKELLKLVMEKRVQHGAHPVLRWHVDNVMVEEDAAGNIKPSRKKSTEKIDGAVALIMAMGRAVTGGLSIYESRGAVVL